VAVATWQDWAVGVLAGIKAPSSPTNIATLRGWSTHEKGTWPSIQWANPLNTTEPWPGAVDSGAQPGAHDVKIYPSLEAGVGATVRTLIGEPFYPHIVANLRASLPASWWVGAARTELDTWGTGQSWLDSVPLTEDVMKQLDRIQSIVEGLGGRFWPISGSVPTVQNQLNTIQADASKAATAGGAGVAADLTALTKSVATLTTKVDAMAATLTKIESSLKGP